MVNLSFLDEKLRGVMSTEELLTFLCKRAEFLEALADSPMDKRDLVDEVGGF